MELRKQKEVKFQNTRRDESLKSSNKHEYLNTNKKFYSIVRKSGSFAEKWLAERCPNKKILDYCCGNGGMSLEIAKMGAAEIVGIDISDLSIENAKRDAVEKGVSKQIQFSVMDAEKTIFDDNTFDVIYESGVLHHLDLHRAYSELARILKPNGQMMCNEALGHNPLIHYYRKKTPHLRTEWEAEHILRKENIELAKAYFEKVEILGFFHLASIAAVPFRNLPGFNVILGALEAVDGVMLKLPGIKWQAWQVIFALSAPKYGG